MGAEKDLRDHTMPLSGARTGNLSFVLLSIILIAVTFSFYAGSLTNEFVWDDNIFIVQNPFIHDFSHCREVLTRNVAHSSGARNNFYRPVYSLLNMFNYVTGGGKPFVFHLTNIFLHAACSVLVFFLIFLISRNVFIAFATALFFSAHPVQTQAVTYIAGRADPLYSVFVLCSIICFIVYMRNRRNILLYFVSLISFALALLSKEVALVTPFLIALYLFSVADDTGTRGKGKWLLTVPFFVVLASYLLTRATVLDFSKTAFSTLSLPALPFYVRALTACKAVFLYFRFLFYPVGFHMETHLAGSGSIMEVPTLMAVIGIVLVLLLFILFWKRSKLKFFGLAWFFIGLLPVLNLYPVNAFIAVHWLYLPCAGLFFLVNLVLWDLLQSRKTGGRNKVFLFLFITLSAGAILGTLTYRKNMEWKDDETLYKSILPYSQTPRVYINLGNIYAGRNEFDKAVPCYLKALKIAPGQTEAYANLGYIYIEMGEHGKAEQVLLKAVEISPKHANSHFNLGVAYANMGRNDKALEEINKAIELNPQHASALNVKGKIYLRLGKRTEAKGAFSRSLRIKPDQPEIRNMLARLK